MKDIPGYEDQYTVSREGEVLSTPKDGKRNRILKQEVMNSHSHTSYRRVTLSKNGKTKRFMVHRLVAQAFIPNPDNKPQVNHIDNNGENNHMNNLEWCTGSENMQHSSKQGRQAEGRRLGGIKAMAIRAEELWSKSLTLIGKKFGQLTVTQVIKTTCKAKRTKYICSCDCGSIELVKREKASLLNKIKPYCAECAQKLRRKNDL